MMENQEGKMKEKKGGIRTTNLFCSLTGRPALKSLPLEQIVLRAKVPAPDKYVLLFLKHLSCNIKEEEKKRRMSRLLINFFCLSMSFERRNFLLLAAEKHTKTEKLAELKQSSTLFLKKQLINKLA